MSEYGFALMYMNCAKKSHFSATELFCDWNVIWWNEFTQQLGEQLTALLVDAACFCPLSWSALVFTHSKLSSLLKCRVALAQASFCNVLHTYVCTYTCMYIRMRVCVCACTHTSRCMSGCVCMCVTIYVRMYICMYIHTYIRTYVHTNVYLWWVCNFCASSPTGSRI
jgi:hypothetical protein